MRRRSKVEPFTEVPESVLVVVAHPDDADFGCAGTVAKWARAGSEVSYLICTNGNKGSKDPEMTPDRLAAIRKKEQLDAAAVLGVKDVVFLDYPDGELEDTKVARGEIVREIRRHRPKVVITFDIYRSGFYQHRDHRMAGQMALDACYPYARDILHYPEQIREGLQPHKVGAAFLSGAEVANIFVDISDTVELKVEALRKHASQISEDRLERLIKEWAERSGRLAGLKYAEGFRRIEFRG